MIYSENDYRNYLAHHGINGQKWGKRNGPPYPLDAADHSASEKKAGWRKSLSESGKGSGPSKRDAKRTMKKLNALDQKRAEQNRKVRDVQKKIDRVKDKQDRTYSDTSRRYKRLEKKLAKLNEKKIKKEQPVKESEKKISDVLKAAKKKGYNIESKNIQRSTLTTWEKYKDFKLTTASYGNLIGATRTVGNRRKYGYQQSVKKQIKADIRGRDTANYGKIAGYQIAKNTRNSIREKNRSEDQGSKQYYVRVRNKKK